MKYILNYEIYNYEIHNYERYNYEIYNEMHIRNYNLGLPH